jgi:hypothetical protein
MRAPPSPGARPPSSPLRARPSCGGTPLRLGSCPCISVSRSVRFRIRHFLAFGGEGRVLFLGRTRSEWGGEEWEDERRAGVGVHVHGGSRWNGDARFAVSGLRSRWQRANERGVVSKRGIGHDRGGVCCRVADRCLIRAELYTRGSFGSRMRSTRDADCVDPDSRARVYLEHELPRADRRRRRSSLFPATFLPSLCCCCHLFPSLASRCPYIFSVLRCALLPIFFSLSFLPLSSTSTHTDARFQR